VASTRFRRSAIGLLPIRTILRRKKYTICCASQDHLWTEFFLAWRHNIIETVDMSKIWKCPYCGQSIEVDTRKRPPGYFETCKLRDRMIGDECIAYRDPKLAEALIKKLEG
jgi:hypothetical protein